jgi:hypothetical protein
MAGATGTATLWQKVLKPGNGSAWTKDDALDIAHWTRQILSVALGVVWGILAFHGWLAFAIYAAVVSLALIIFIGNYLKISEEVIDRWSIVKESFPTGVSGFVITWIFFYNLFHSQ